MLVLAPTVDTRAERSGANTFALSGGLVPMRATVPVAPTLSSRRTAGGGLGSDFDYDGGLIIEPKAVAVALRGRENGYTAELGDEIANALRAGDGGGSKAFVLSFAENRREEQKETQVIPILEAGKRVGTSQTDPRAGMGVGQAGDPMFTLQASAQHAVSVAQAVRRLTPTECERLQGFPEGWTQVPFRNKPAADGPRYKALGNSMAVPVMRWIGNRINIVDNRIISDRLLQRD